LAHWRDALASEELTRTLSDLARDLRATHGANEAQILITVDQAEELFGAAEKTGRSRFCGCSTVCRMNACRSSWP